MSKFEFKLPDIGEGVTEGEIVSWLVAVGDEVTEDQDMVEVMTDKATVTIGAPQAGRVVSLGGAEGDVVPVGGVLVVFDTTGSSAAAFSEPASVQESAATAVGDIKETLPGISVPRAEPTPVTTSEKPLAAPATRKLARELGLELGKIPASGSAGRITREDVEAFAASAGRAQSVTPPVAKSLATPPALPISAPAASPQDQRVPIRGLRKRIFENMARSTRTAAHFTYADEVECTKLIALRERTRPYADEAGIKLTYLPFIVKAVVCALKKNPMLNTWVDDTTNEMIHKATYDIGIATATETGLVVPVVRNADRLSIIGISREISRMAADARVGKIQAQDVGGSTFTVTSLGRLGGLFSTPVVNYPEVAIMGVHEMKKRPVIVDDEIRIGNVMVLALSFDHRIIDGHVGAAFAQDVKALLEEPDRLFVEMS